MPQPVGWLTKAESFGIDELRAILRPQVKPADIDRFHLAAPSARL